MEFCTCLDYKRARIRKKKVDKRHVKQCPYCPRKMKKRMKQHKYHANEAVVAEAIENDEMDKLTRLLMNEMRAKAGKPARTATCATTQGALCEGCNINLLEGNLWRLQLACTEFQVKQDNSLSQLGAQGTHLWLHLKKIRIKARRELLLKIPEIMDHVKKPSVTTSRSSRRS